MLHFRLHLDLIEIGLNITPSQFSGYLRRPIIDSRGDETDEQPNCGISFYDTSIFKPNSTNAQGKL